MRRCKLKPRHFSPPKHGHHAVRKAVTTHPPGLAELYSPLASSLSIPRLAFISFTCPRENCADLVGGGTRPTIHLLYLWRMNESHPGSPSTDVYTNAKVQPVREIDLLRNTCSPLPSPERGKMRLSTITNFTQTKRKLPGDLLFVSC